MVNNIKSQTINFKHLSMNKLFNYIFTLSAAITLFVSCAERKTVENQLITIDVSKSYPMKELHLQDIADVEYIPLAATDTFLLSGNARLSYIGDTQIIIFDVTSSSIMIFDMNGNPRTYINRKGSSNEEYNYLTDVKYDAINNELLTVEVFPTRIRTYDLNGKFIRVKELQDKSDANSLVDFDNYKLLFSKTGLAMSLNEETKDNKDSAKYVHYYLLSKHDLNVTDSFSIQVPNIVKAYHMERSENMASIMLYTYKRATHSDNGSLILSDISSDTIYRLSNTLKLTPLIVRTPSVHASETMTCLNVDMDLPDYMFFQYGITKKTEKDIFTKQHLCYEKKSGQISEYKFINDDYKGLDNAGIVNPIVNFSSSTNKYVNVLFQAGDLLEALEAGKLSGKLKEIASGLTDDDNPVLMLARFK